MEFDECANPYSNSDDSWTNFETARAKWHLSGLKLPTIVFWNVSARGSHLPITAHHSGATLISGASPSVFKLALSGTTPESLMNQVIESERYNKIIIKEN